MQVLTRGFGSSIPTFVGFMPIWMSWLLLDRIIMFSFVLSKKVSDRRHLSELCTPGFGRPQQRLRKSTPGARVWLFMLEKDSAPSERARERERAIHSCCPGMALYVREEIRAFRENKFECSSHSSCVSYLQYDKHNFRLGNLHAEQCQRYRLSEASYQLGQCRLCSQMLYM